MCVCPYIPTVAPNSGGRTPGSKLPASPPPLPRPDGGGQPWPCACAHGPEKEAPSAHQRVDELPLMPHTTGTSTTMPMYCNQAAKRCNCGSSTVSPQTYTCVAAQTALRPMPYKWTGSSCGCRRKNATAADPVLEHATTLNNDLVLDVFDGVFSLHRLYADPGKIVSTIKREIFTTTQHRNAPNALVL